jgi:hypothetical protein
MSTDIDTDPPNIAHWFPDDDSGSFGNIDCSGTPDFSYIDTDIDPLIIALWFPSLGSPPNNGSNDGGACLQRRRQAGSRNPRKNHCFEGDDDDNGGGSYSHLICPPPAFALARRLPLVEKKKKMRANVANDVDRRRMTATVDEDKDKDDNGICPISLPATGTRSRAKRGETTTIIGSPRRRRRRRRRIRQSWNKGQQRLFLPHLEGHHLATSIALTASAHPSTSPGRRMRVQGAAEADTTKMGCAATSTTSR